MMDIHRQAQAAKDSLIALLPQPAPVDMEQDPPAQPSPTGVKHTTSPPLRPAKGTKKKSKLAPQAPANPPPHPHE